MDEEAGLTAREIDKRQVGEAIRHYGLPGRLVVLLPNPALLEGENGRLHTARQLLRG